MAVWMGPASFSLRTALFSRAERIFFAEQINVKSSKVWNNGECGWTADQRIKGRASRLPPTRVADADHVTVLVTFSPKSRTSIHVSSQWCHKSILMICMVTKRCLRLRDLNII